MIDRVATNLIGRHIEWSEWDSSYGDVGRVLAVWPTERDGLAFLVEITRGFSEQIGWTRVVSNGSHKIREVRFCTFCGVWCPAHDFDKEHTHAG